MGSLRKIGEGDIVECFAQDVMGKRLQSTGQGKQNQTDNRRTGSKGSCHRGRDQAGVTEHSDG